MENLRRFFSISDVRGGKYFLNEVWLKYDHFFIAKLIICLVWIKKIARTTPLFLTFCLQTYFQ
jgi:hypothetical protein